MGNSLNTGKPCIRYFPDISNFWSTKFNGTKNKKKRDKKLEQKNGTKIGTKNGTKIVTKNGTNVKNR